jgi:crotonobetainyl-CoA:carnitine CoA-transferase CaiB-like acyl-CoA transferase
MLSNLRVIELSSPETMLAGQILADLGADVVSVEPPGGAAGRRLEPFVDDLPGLERSLVWIALNRNKRGITLARDDPDGQAILSALTERADVLIEAASGGLEPQEIASQPASRLVRCVIRPFSLLGPKAGYRATDWVITAAGGALGNMGDTDRPPAGFPVPQAMMEASSEAVVGILAALLGREGADGGQLVEVSARLASLLSSFGQPMLLATGNPEGKRTGGVTPIGSVDLPPVYACKDGFASVTVAFGPGFGALTRALAKWLHEEGLLPGEVAEINWVSFPLDVVVGKAKLESLSTLVDAITELCRTRSKQELSSGARERGLLMAPVMEMSDIDASPQHDERGLWAEMELPGSNRRVRVAARFAHFSDYRIEVRRPPPTLSQHTLELLREELSFSTAEIQALFVHGIV